MPRDIWVSTRIPTRKSLSDRLKKIVGKHSVGKRDNETSSGIVENSREREELLDDIILVMDEKVEDRRTGGKDYNG